MKKLWAIIALILLALLAAYFILGGNKAFAPEPGAPVLNDRTGGGAASSSGSSIDFADYGNKVVYATDVEADTAPYEADCRARGGEFNYCGDPCPPNTESCIAVCAYTCDNISR